MALRLTDGAEHYAGADIMQKWTAIQSDAQLVNDGRTGSYSISLQGAAGTAYIYKTLDAQNTWVVGAAFKIVVGNGTGSGDGKVLEIYDTSGAGDQIYLALDAAGDTLSLYRGDDVLLASSSRTIDYDTWYHISVQATINNTTGSYNVYLNGVQILGASGVDTQATANATADRITFHQYYAEELRIDDVYILDGTGSKNNSNLGDCVVHTLFPNGVGTYTDFSVVGAANNWAAVNETPPDDDTSYVWSHTGLARDTYAMQDLSGTTGNVYGVVLYSWMKKTDAGNRGVYLAALSGGTELLGSQLGVTTGYTSYSEIFEDDPAGGNWDGASVNAAEFGIKIAADSLPVTLNLIAHWDFDALSLSDGDPISTLTDQSGNGNNLTQTGANRPTYKTAIQNGRAIGRFLDTSTQYLADTSAPVDTGQTYTLFIVAKTNDATQAQMLFYNGTSSTNGYGPWFDGTNQGVLHGGIAGYADSTYDTGWHVYEIACGTNVNMWVDGTQVLTNQGGSPNVPSTQTSLGAQQSGSNPWDGDIGEVVWYSDEKGDSDRSSVRSWLGTRWGITVS